MTDNASSGHTYKIKKYILSYDYIYHMIISNDYIKIYHIYHMIIVIRRVFCCKDTKNHNLQLNLSNSYFALIILISEQKVNIPGILINNIKDSFISY